MSAAEAVTAVNAAREPRQSVAPPAQRGANCQIIHRIHLPGRSKAVSTKQNGLDPICVRGHLVERALMDWIKATNGAEAAVLSRRETLAGIGLAALFALAGPKLLASAEAKPVDVPAIDTEATSEDASTARATEDISQRADTGDAFEFSSRHWRRRYWRRRYWRHRYWRHRWRRRHWHHPYWRRRYWRRRYWRRRYW